MREKKKKEKEGKKEKRKRKKGGKLGEGDGEEEEVVNKTKPREDKGFRQSMSCMLREQGCPCDGSETGCVFLVTLLWPCRLGEMKMVCREQISYILVVRAHSYLSPGSWGV